MGFQKPDLDAAWREIARCMAEVRSPYNDGWTSAGCKQDLYQLKSWLDEEYQRLPRFVDEDQWEKQRMWNKLKDSR
jgi:hypothetical protein